MTTVSVQYVSGSGEGRGGRIPCPFIPQIVVKLAWTWMWSEESVVARQDSTTVTGNSGVARQSFAFRCLDIKSLQPKGKNTFSNQQE